MVWGFGRDRRDKQLSDCILGLLIGGKWSLAFSAVRQRRGRQGNNEERG